MKIHLPFSELGFEPHELKVRLRSWYQWSSWNHVYFSERCSVQFENFVLRVSITLTTETYLCWRNSTLFYLKEESIVWGTISMTEISWRVGKKNVLLNFKGDQILMWETNQRCNILQTHRHRFTCWRQLCLFVLPICPSYTIIIIIIIIITHNKKREQYMGGN